MIRVVMQMSILVSQYSHVKIAPIHLETALHIIILDGQIFWIVI